MKKMLVVALFALLGMAGPAHAQESAEAEAEVTAEESAEESAAEAEKLPFGGSLSLGSRVGMGTFANDGYARRPLMTGRLGLSAYYAPTAPQRLSVGIGFTKYLVENSDTGVAEDGQTLIEDHRDVTAKRHLNLHGALWRQERLPPVYLVCEGDAFLGHR